MLDPSKPIPSSNRSSVSSEVEMEKCCQSPGTSTNLKSMISTLFFLENSITSRDVIADISFPFIAQTARVCTRTWAESLGSLYVFILPSRVILLRDQVLRLRRIGRTKGHSLPFHPSVYEWTDQDC